LNLLLDGAGLSTKSWEVQDQPVAIGKPTGVKPRTAVPNLAN